MENMKIDYWSFLNHALRSVIPHLSFLGMHGCSVLRSSYTDSNGMLPYFHFTLCHLAYSGIMPSMVLALRCSIFIWRLYFSEAAAIGRIFPK